MAREVLCQEAVPADPGQVVTPLITYGQCARQEKRIFKYSPQVWSPRKQGLKACVPQSRAALQVAQALRGGLSDNVSYLWSVGREDHMSYSTAHWMAVGTPSWLPFPPEYW